jgi:phosphoribosylanthranilate isomerase
MWIKICGLNDRATARAIAALRPDAIGLNFYEKSVRRVTPEVARQIVDELPDGVQPVGVFVDPTIETVAQLAAGCRLEGVQIHSSRLADCFYKLHETHAGLKRIRAFQVGSPNLKSLGDYFDHDRLFSPTVDAYLVDAYAEGMFGGTGKIVSWDLLRNEYQKQEWPPLILAGGLRPENVGEAIEAVRPWGVDVASGVESAPGVKDVALVERFIDEARRAFARLAANSNPMSP